MPRQRPRIGGGISRSIRRQTQELLKTGKRFERFDQIRQRHFWSTCIFAPDANGYISGARQLFVTPAGQNGQGFPSGSALNETDTNWKSSNRVPDNQNFEVTELGITLLPLGSVIASGADQVSFLQNTVVNITYLTNSVPLGMASDFAQAGGPTKGTFQPAGDVSTPMTGVPARTPTNGFASPALRRRFKIPILLQHGETFSFELAMPRAAHIDAASGIAARLDFWATESFAEKS